MMLHPGDVAILAEELGSEHRKPPVTEAELVADNGELFAYIRDMQNQLMLMSRRIGELEAENRMLPGDVDDLQEQLVKATARAELYEKLYEEERNRSWWRRMFGE
ncbi:MAG: hypothetical protein M3380_18995 [Chloroflexota bacterium]|nr:hypothetical protein [Chloroflexota bacterium]